VIAAIALRHRRPAKLAAPDDQRLIEQATLFQVLQQRRRPLIDLAGRPRDAVLDAAVVRARGNNPDSI
jgi:hypothetical protein